MIAIFHYFIANFPGNFCLEHCKIYCCNESRKNIWEEYILYFFHKLFWGQTLLVLAVLPNLDDWRIQFSPRLREGTYIFYNTSLIPFPMTFHYIGERNRKFRDALGFYIRFRSCKNENNWNLENNSKSRVFSLF